LAETKQFKHSYTCNDNDIIISTAVAGAIWQSELNYGITTSGRAPYRHLPVSVVLGTSLVGKHGLRTTLA